MKFPKTNRSQGMNNREETPNNLAEYLNLPSNSTKAHRLVNLFDSWKKSTSAAKKTMASNGQSNGQSDKIQGLANFIEKIQITLNQHFETLQDSRKEEWMKEANTRREDNFYLAIKSFGALVGFLLFVAAIGALTIWLRNKCKKSKREIKQRDQELAELKKRLKAIEEGGDE